VHHHALLVSIVVVGMLARAVTRADGSLMTAIDGQPPSVPIFPIPPLPVSEPAGFSFGAVPVKQKVLSPRVPSTASVVGLMADASRFRRTGR